MPNIIHAEDIQKHRSLSVHSISPEEYRELPTASLMSLKLAFGILNVTQLREHFFR